jgi:ferredoxin
MANIANKFSENVPGQFYVDKQCIDCDLCRQCAPTIFKRHFAGGMGHSYVGRQPLTPQEKSVAMDTMRACPVEAIGCTSPVEQTDEYHDSSGSIGLFNAVAVA